MARKKRQKEEEEEKEEKAVLILQECCTVCFSVILTVLHVCVGKYAVEIKFAVN